MIIPTGYAQANFRFIGAGVPTGAEMTLGFDVTGYLAGPDDLASDLHGLWNGDDIPSSYCDALNMAEVEVKFGPNATGPSAIFQGNAVGLRTSAVVQPNTSVLIHKVTALGGRAGRGRMYSPGFNEGNIDGAGLITGGVELDIQNDWNTYLGHLQGIDAIPVVLHGVGSPITTPTPITTFVVDQKVATQRRRLRR